MSQKYHLILFLVCSFFLGMTGKAQSYYFPPINGQEWETLAPESLSWCPENVDSLYRFLENNHTKAFILLQDGKIVLEQYFGTHTQNSYWYWASAGKTITAFMVGIAQQEGFLSIEDPTSDYLGAGWTNCTPEQEQQITILHQLTMTSGLDDEVPDNYCTFDSCLIYKADAGTRWSYHNAPYTLLDSVLQSATGNTLNNYVTQKLKTPIGMNGLFYKTGYNNVFFSDARSMARFGLLILNGGEWDGQRLMTEIAYFSHMTHPSQSLNQAYGYLWWLNGSSTFMVPGFQYVLPGSFSPHAPQDMIAALGKNGQFINVIPSSGQVWIRMGENPDSTEVPFLFNDRIWEYLNALDCTSLGVNNYTSATDNVHIFPNPAAETVTITANREMERVEIYSMDGKKVQFQELRADSGVLTINELSEGFYLLRIYMSGGLSVTRKMIKTCY